MQQDLPYSTVFTVEAGEAPPVPCYFPKEIEAAIADWPEDENEFISDMMEVVDASKYNPAEYDLKA